MTRAEAQQEIIRQTALYGGGVILRDEWSRVWCWNTDEHKQEENGVLLYEGRPFSEANRRFYQWAVNTQKAAALAYKAIEARYILQDDGSYLIRK